MSHTLSAAMARRQEKLHLPEMTSNAAGERLARVHAHINRHQTTLDWDELPMETTKS